MCGLSGFKIEATKDNSLDISAYALKRLLNHKMANEVTVGHIISDVERLRVPMQKITDYILTSIGQKEKADVIPIQLIQASA